MYKLTNLYHYSYEKAAMFEGIAEASNAVLLDSEWMELLIQEKYGQATNNGNLYNKPLKCLPCTKLLTTLSS